jgi:hypothetical protein
MSDKPIERCEFESQKLLVRPQFTIRADVKAISPVVEGVVKIVHEMECAEGKELEIETALREGLPTPSSAVARTIAPATWGAAA